MFGRLAAARIKAAEEALAHRRLEEAMEILRGEDLSGNRRGAQLLERLAEAFLERGQDALLGRQASTALADFELAARCGCPDERIEPWRKRARAAMQQAHADDRDREAALAVARQRLAAGSLAGAADALAKAPMAGDEGVRLADEIAQQESRASKLLADAGQAMGKGDVAAAVELLRKAERLHSTVAGLAEMETKIIDGVMKETLDSFKRGRLDRVEQDLERIAELDREHDDRTDMQEAMRLAREAAKALADDRYARASVLLGRLAQISPKAGWISDVRKHLEVLEDRRQQLLEGPLGLLAGHEVPSVVGRVSAAGDVTLPVPPKMEVAPPPKHKEPVGHLPRSLLLRVDGAGSFLLLRTERVSVGRAGPGASADLQLMSDLSERQAEVIRAGEDYFVVSGEGVELAGRPVDHALLQDGDRVRLGKRVRLTFRRPSMKSPTACLDLGDGVRMATDCRRAILWSGPLLMGGTRECHVRLGSGSGSWILMERGGRLYVKPMGSGGEALPVALGEQVDFGELRMTVQAWPPESSVGRVVG